MRRDHRRWAILGAAIAIVALVGVLRGSGALERVEHATVDTRFRVRGAEDPPRDVVVVAIGDGTLAALNRQWPYPRSWHGEVIRALSMAGARAIGYDIAFSEPGAPAGAGPGAESAAASEDEQLWNAMRTSNRVVAGVAEFDGATPHFFRARELARSSVRVGNVGWATDAASRRLRPDLGGVASFPLAVAQAAGAAVDVDAIRDSAYVDYAGGPGTITTIPFEDVLDGRLDADAVRDRVVIVGATASRLQDLHPTPFGGGLMAGPEVQANAVATLLRGNPLRGVSWPVTALVTLLLVGAIVAAAWRPRGGFLAIASGAALAALLVGAQVAFTAGLVIDLTTPLLAVVLTAVAALVITALTEGRERRRLRAVFGRFLPPALVDEMVAAADRTAGIPGRRMQATVLFADLRGFTAVAERMPPEQVIEILNRWLGDVGDAVMDAGGTLVSYQGDGVMAVFGAPVEQPDHADRALRAAREIRDRRLAEFRAWAGEHGLDAPVAVGVGVATGPVMSGTVGSRRRLEYAAVGDTTNAAARLQSLTRDIGRTVAVSDATRAALTAPAPDLVPVGAHEVRGKSVPAGVWTLRSAHDPTHADGAG